MTPRTETDRRSLDEALFVRDGLFVPATFEDVAHGAPPPEAVPPPAKEPAPVAVRDGGSAYQLMGMAPGVFEMRETPPVAPPPPPPAPPVAPAPPVRETVVETPFVGYSFPEPEPEPLPAPAELEPVAVEIPFVPDPPPVAEVEIAPPEPTPPEPEPPAPEPPPRPACVLDVNEPLDLDAGGSAVIRPRHLRVTGPEPAQVELMILSPVQHGSLARDGVAMTGGDTFTQADIDAGKLRYHHSGNAAGVDSFLFATPDGELPTTPFSITVRKVRRAPELLGQGQLAGVVEGCRVADVLDCQANCPDGVPGLAVVGIAGRGTWHFSLDGMRTWRELPAATHGAALPLREDDALRFTPVAGWSGTVRLMYRAWDGSAGAAGEATDISERGATGGATAFSRDAVTLTLRVTAPVTESPALPWMEEPTVGEFAGGGLAVTRIEGPGAWQFSTDDGLTWQDFGATYHGRARLLRDEDRVRLLVKEDAAGKVVFAGRPWDGRGAAGDVANLAPRASHGDGTPFGEFVRTRTWRLA